MDIRPLQAKDYESLTNHLNPWNYQKKGVAYFEWLARLNPSENISMAAIADDRVVGYYGTIPVPFKIGDRTVIVYRGGVFIHPDHRKRKDNILNALVSAVERESKKRNAVVCGFPIPKLAKYLEKNFGAASLKPISHYIFILKIGPSIESIFKNVRISRILARVLQPLWNLWIHRDTEKDLPGIKIVPIHSFDKSFDLLWEKASLARSILSMRNAEYLNWRYLEEPGQRYTIFAAKNEREVLGYVILKDPGSSQEKKGQVIDLFDTRDPAVTKRLLDQAMNYFKAKGAACVECYLSDDFYEKTLRSIGFYKLRPRPERSEFLVAKLYSPDIQDKVFYDPRSWFLTRTDMLFA